MWMRHSAADERPVPTHIIITDIRVEYLNGPNVASSTFGELCAYFNPAQWVVALDGLIYTSTTWLTDFRIHLRTRGFSERAVMDIGYSESGMQGDNYVSMDIGPDFIRELDPLLAFTKGKKFEKVVTIADNACRE